VCYNQFFQEIRRMWKKNGYNRYNRFFQEIKRMWSVHVDFKNACARNPPARIPDFKNACARNPCTAQDDRFFVLLCAFVAALPKFCPEQPLKTALECINPEKTLTVREALFWRESVPLSMHGCMESMVIKKHTFCVRPCTTAHFCYVS
jgi:hypothetical protein